MQQDLDQIKTWLQLHAPATLHNLNLPATPAEIAAVEAAVGLQLPDAFKQFLRQHDGDRGLTLDAFFGDYHEMLSCERIIQQYQLEQDIGRRLYDPHMATHEFWRDRVSHQIIFVYGAVQPLMLHPLWIPITNMNGDVLRYLDFDPAAGGVPGQVIEVDAESCAYQVIAPSFAALLSQYRQELASGKYSLNADGALESAYDIDVMSWGVPDWLK
jgi:cell wall assembly regulator SMI1